MRYLFLFITLSFFSFQLSAQQKDSVQKQIPAPVKKDSVKPERIPLGLFKKDSVHVPRKATLRSAVIPGWGQAYNKKYWKIPIVWGALGTAAGFFVYNRREYIDARDAYRYMKDTIAANDVLIKPKFRPVDPEAVRQYRIAVRQYVDYSVLAFIMLWGLNVVDATVDGHLKAFDVNDNLSLRINPTYNPISKQANVGLVFSFGK